MAEVSERAIVLAPVTMAWFKEQFQTLNDKLDALAENDQQQSKQLKQIKQSEQTTLENQVAADAKLDQILGILQPPVDPNSPITPELEAAVNEAVKLATSIDQKVPDKPPPMPPTLTPQTT